MCYKKGSSHVRIPFGSLITLLDTSMEADDIIVSIFIYIYASFGVYGNICFILTVYRTKEENARGHSNFQ